VLVALSSGQKTGLAVVAAAFVVFALASSFLFPRWNPNFPGRWLKVFVLVCVLFTVGMLAAVIGFAKESHEEGAHGTEPTPTHTTPSTTGGTETTPPPVQGDPVAGKEVFTEKACGSCHTFEPAGTSGTVGPDLDELADAAENAGKELHEFVRESIVDPNAYVAPGFQPGIMPDFGDQLTPKEVDDLVAFLTQGA
jgi:cytochrome c551/c552